MEFEWDELKAVINLRQHGISFAYAARIFEDVERIERPDTRLDYGEERWITIGFVDRFELVVVYTLRGSRVRIISARKATSDERKRYWENR